MTREYPVVEFFGRRFLLIGSPFEDDGTGWPLATREQYNNFRPSYAHLFPDGRVLRYGVEIGTASDVRLTGEVG